MIIILGKWLKSSIWSTTTPDQIRPGSNGNKEVLHIPQSFRIGALPSHAVSHHTQDTHLREELPLCRKVVGLFYSLSWHDGLCNVYLSLIQSLIYFAIYQCFNVYLRILDDFIYRLWMLLQVCLWERECIYVYGWRNCYAFIWEYLGNSVLQGMSVCQFNKWRI